jgi:short-subunit dehydrogenase
MAMNNSTYALITGASRGIGRELARIMASKGYSLLLSARDTSALQQLSQELHAEYSIQADYLACDLGKAEDVEKLITHIRQHNLQIKFLINNAGAGVYGEFLSTEWSQHHQIMMLNMCTVTRLCYELMPDLIRNQGRILNIASTAAFVPGPLLAVYYATKAYVLSLSQALRFELREKGVPITTVCPGPTHTGFQQAAGMTQARVMNIEYLPNAACVAHFAYNAMMKGKNIAIQGLLNKLLIFGTRLIPRSLAIRIVYTLQKMKK